MKKLYSIAAALMLGAIGAQAGQLFVVGEATQYGWSLDDAQALLSTPENDNIYTGTLYLKADQVFKFLTTYEWGGTEYGAETGASLTDGKVALASGSNDNGYDQIKVAEDGNYLITVDTESLSATIV
ncbi:MAG: SusF/SusE family outer membrane protein, partial [Muribaculaceae bacterium]|nr:SusF/SusE family outer membrane protein [Muribaculaceae bacterium]